MVLEWFKTVVKALGDSTKYMFDSQMYDIDSEPENLSLPGSNNQDISQKQNDIRLLQLKLQYIQENDRQKLQTELAKLGYEFSQQLQEFVQQVELAQQQNDLAFQAWRLEQEKSLQLEMLEHNYEIQRSLAAYKRQTSLQVIEEQKRVDNSPILLVISDILNSYTDDDITPLRVFIAPPKIQFERFANAIKTNKEFPDIELTLAEAIRIFFRNYSTQNRAIDFIGGAWVSKQYHSEASIKTVFAMMKSEPTLILESEVDGDYLNFRIGYWGLNWSKYRYDPVISKLPYREILNESARARARKWMETREKLIAAGENPEEVDRIYGQDNVINLEILQREERLRQAGIDSKELDINYNFNKKDFNELCNFLIVYHCLFAGLVADEYFLIQYNLPPLLPQLLPDLLKPVSDRQTVKEMIEAVVLYYQNIYKSLGSQRSTWVPELALNLAQTLTNLTDKSWAKQQIIYSIKAWLELRNISQPEGLEHSLRTLEKALTIEDQDYISKLNQCLAAIGNSKQLSILEACYKRGIFYSQQKEYKAAALDFSQAIQINSRWAEAYYNRGFVYSKLGEYQKAIADYTQAIEINPKWADAYNNRGNVYYKLGNYEQTIADYNQALQINPDFSLAAKNLTIAQGVVEKLKNKPQHNLPKQPQDYGQAKIQANRVEAVTVITPTVESSSENDQFDWDTEENSYQQGNFYVDYTLIGHSNSVRCLAISPDGVILASGSYDKTIKLWNLGTGKEIRTLTGHTNSVLSLAISPDGAILASGSYDKTIKLWNLHTGEQINTLSGHSTTVLALAISPDGQLLVSGSYDNTIKLWHLSTGKEIGVLTGHVNSVWSLAISPDGEILASGSDDNTINIWHLKTGRKIRTLRGHLNTILSLAISTDGEILASGSYDKTIKLWHLETGKEIATLNGHTNSVWSLAISPDGKTLVSGSYDKMIKLWDLNTKEEIATFNGHSNSVWAVAISPDGKTLASGSYDKTIKVWRML